MSHIAVLLDAEWVKRELLLRGRTSQWLIANGISHHVVTSLLQGRPVAKGTLLKLNALFKVTPYAPEYEYVAKGMAS